MILLLAVGKFLSRMEQTVDQELLCWTQVPGMKEKHYVHALTVCTAGVLSQNLHTTVVN